MTQQEFQQSIEDENPPVSVGPALAALWWDAKGNWEKAHDRAQEDKGQPGAWVHAYLHRKEGDIPNANYWYARAGKPECKVSLDQEWKEITSSLLAQ
ncbi:MAG TPA: hypothetical protein VH088_07860 [Terriglobales bacterium]|jgi:hypothetical protein|nr:hypothetical protein [Terriglobales bacterium]